MPPVDVRAGADRADGARGMADRRRGRPRRGRRRSSGRRCGRRSAPAGGGASAISSPACGGSARRFSSTPTSSPGRCRSACSACRPRWRSFPPLGFALARLIWRPDATRVLALAVGLGFSEWLRCVVLTGFPWNELGMALGANLELAQIASIVGLHGLTLLAVAIFAAPATLWTETRRRWPPTALAAARARGDLRLRRLARSRRRRARRCPTSRCG